MINQSTMDKLIEMRLTAMEMHSVYKWMIPL